MKIYEFRQGYCDSRIAMLEYEAEEKPKTYIIPERRSRVSKADIGKINYSSVYLLENDINKAIELFLNKYRSEIERENRHHEMTVTEKTKNIKILEEQLHE